MKKLLIHCLLMLIPCSVGADTLLVGEDYGIPPLYSGGSCDSPSGSVGELASTSKWKCFMATAEATGTADVMYVQFADETEADDLIDIGVALYNHNGAVNQPYQLMASGCESDLDISSYVEGDWFYITLTPNESGPGATVTNGEDYFLCYWDSSYYDHSTSQFWVTRCDDDDTPVKVIRPSSGTLSTCSVYDSPEPWGTSGVAYLTGEYAGTHGLKVVDLDGGTTTTSAVSTTTTSCTVPTINLVSGNITHGGTISISGDCFGTKSPVAPLMWDDCESKTVDSDAAVAAVWDEVEPPVGTANQAAYRTRYRTIPYRSKAAPHEYSTKYLAGGHYTYANNSPVYIGGAAEGYKNVMVTADSGVRDKDKWYVSYYYALDNNWMSTCYNYMNHKTDSINSAATAYGIVSEYVYNMYWGNNAPCNSTVYMNISHLDDDCDPSFPSGFTAVNNPRNDWVKMETIINGTAGSTNYRGMLVDNVVGVEYEDCAAWDTLDNQTRSVTIGGYFRHATDLDDTDTYSGRSGGTVASPENNSFRFFDDMYIDYTWARIMMCDSSTYPTTDSYVCEPQIPNTTWNNNAIQATVNLGRINTYTAYVYVIDDDGNVSSGYAVDLEEGQVTTTTTISIGGVAVGGVSIQ